MTILITALRTDFVLSVADRRSSIQIGNLIVPEDERFNKHIYFASSQVRAAATFTGMAQWRSKTGTSVTTDYILGNMLSLLAKRKANFGTTLYYLAESLAPEIEWIRTTCNFPNPNFTIVISGFSLLFFESWFAIITNRNDKPDFEKAVFSFELPAPYPFRIYLGLFSTPFVYVGGCTSALPQDTVKKLYELLNLPHVRAYDVANLAASEIQRANKASSAIGDRVSAIVLPANGWVDTGLWDHPDEPLRGAMPRMVYPDGRQWEPSEVKLQFEDVYIGECQKHSLFFQSLSEGRIPNRARRKLRAFRSSGYEAPTIFQMIGECLFGHEKAARAMDSIYKELEVRLDRKQ